MTLEQRRVTDAVLFLTLGEVLALMGTILTGLFGLIGCCRGFGRLLHAQERLLLERRESEQAGRDQQNTPEI
uniref:Uncharacterized protein n=1 Tax=Plectus sambesii TaxID=2011161 RepID=A0A914UV99_9BILA